jgi:hypothetical protein
MMLAKKNHIKLLTLAIVGALFLIGVTGVQASMHVLPNGTDTSYDAATGKLDMAFDDKSKWDLSPSEWSVTPFKLGLLGTLYEFKIPNFYDPLPLKTVDITVLGEATDPGGKNIPDVLNVVGSDSLYGEPSPAVSVQGMFQNGTSDSTQVWELWHLYPNPDHETVTIFVPTTFDLESIHIVTQSVPLPPAVLLLGSTLFGLVFLRRKVR